MQHFVTGKHSARNARLACQVHQPYSHAELSAFACAHIYAPTSMFARSPAGEPEFRKDCGAA
jgi:hypothetical protein